MIDGAIFDMDGVLVDNVAYHMRAWMQLGRESGKILAEAAIRAVFGQRNREIIGALISSSIGGEELSRLAARKEELYRGFMLPELKPVAGLLEFLDDLRKEGLRTAVATSGPNENAAMVLDGLDIRGYFDTVVTGADVTRSKPDPEVFLIAAQRLGLPPEDCAVFEDSASGIAAARGAGCLCIALATTHKPEELTAHSPDRIILDFRGVRSSVLRGGL